MPLPPSLSISICRHGCPRSPINGPSLQLCVGVEEAPQSVAQRNTDVSVIRSSCLSFSLSRVSSPSHTGWRAVQRPEAAMMTGPVEQAGRIPPPRSRDPTQKNRTNKWQKGKKGERITKKKKRQTNCKEIDQTLLICPPKKRINNPIYLRSSVFTWPSATSSSSWPGVARRWRRNARTAPHPSSTGSLLPW